MNCLGPILTSFTLVTLLTCQGANGFFPSLSQQDSGALLVPWLQPLSWTPVYAAEYNDLEKMLKLRSTQDKWITLFCFSMPENRTGSLEERAFMRVALNTLFSYRVFGLASADIVAALTPSALTECRKFRLPCYDASKYAKDARSFKTINWAKVKLARDILKLGYNVHLSDLDVSYLKPIHSARKEVFSWSHGAADCSMMQEEWVHQDNPQDTASRRPIYLANTGVVFCRANPRSVAFMESLLKYESEHHQEQFIATLVAYNSWAPCTEEASCLAARARGLAAVQLHPNQFAGSNCMPEEGYSPCAPRRLYVHAICRATAVDKEGFLRFMKAMFIANSGAAGSSGGAGGYPAPPSLPNYNYEDAMVIAQQDNAAIAASGLPCPPAQQRAWSGWLTRTAEAAVKELIAASEVSAGAGSTAKKGDEGSKRRLASSGHIDGAGRGNVPRLRG